MKPSLPQWKAVLLLPLLYFSACQQDAQKQLETPVPLPSGTCVTVWQDSTAQAFAMQLEAVTQTRKLVWPNYQLGDGAVVLDAGMTADSTQHCLGLWQYGKPIDYTSTALGPKLSTQLYGYHLDFLNLKEGLENSLLTASQQPEPIANWLKEHGVESAVLMPVDFPNFPFELPTLIKTQIAIHESFHVEVMIRHWFTEAGNWPNWDEQPDRSTLRKCYGENEEEKAAFRDEQLELAKMIEALLDEKLEEALTIGQSYLNMRDERYKRISHIEILRQDSTTCLCAEAESIMELEEGLADYASWTMLYELGTADRAALIRRYQAIQNDPFYLTGAMLMHSISLMNKGEVTPIMEKIINSQDPSSGGLITLFRQELASYGKTPH